MDVGYSQCEWSSMCYRLAPSAKCQVSPHLICTVALWWSMLPFSGAGEKGPECKGYPMLHHSWVGWGWGLEISGRSARVFFPSFPLLVAG